MSNKKDKEKINDNSDELYGQQSDQAESENSRQAAQPEKPDQPVENGKPVRSGLLRPNQWPGRGKKKKTPMMIIVDFAIAGVAILGLYMIISPMIIHWQQDRMTSSLDQAYLLGDSTITIDSDAWPVEGEDVEYVQLETRESESESAETSEPAETVEPEEPEDPEEPEEPEEKKETVVITAIGRIEIEKISLSMPVASRSTVQDLRVAIGHYSPSAQFGESGLTVLLGHRMYSYGRHFNRLDEVEIDDTIILSNKEQRFTYVVDQIRIVEPAEMLDQLTRLDNNEPRLLLVTCHPVRVASHRMLVYATLESVEPLD